MPSIGENLQPFNGLHTSWTKNIKTDLMYRQTFNSNNADEISLKEKKNKQLGLSDMNGRCVLIHMKGDLPFVKVCEN